MLKGSEADEFRSGFDHAKDILHEFLSSYRGVPVSSPAHFMLEYNTLLTLIHKSYAQGVQEERKRRDLVKPKKVVLPQPVCFLEIDEEDECDRMQREYLG